MVAFDYCICKSRFCKCVAYAIHLLDQCQPFPWEVLVHVSVDVCISKVASEVRLDCVVTLLDICTLGTWFYPPTGVVRHIQGLFVVAA